MEDKNQNYDAIWLMVIGFFCLFMLTSLYESYRGQVNSVIMAINRAELLLFSFADDAKALLAGFGWNTPEKYTAKQMLTLTGVTGGYLRWLFAPLLIGLLLHSLRHHGAAENFRTVYTMETLVKRNVQHYPCMAPVATRDILSEPFDSGPWRSARTPLQFAAENQFLLDQAGNPVEHNLLIDQTTGLANEKSPFLRDKQGSPLTFDREKAKEVFTDQLGSAFETVESLPFHYRGLAAAFMAFIAGEKDRGQALLDQMSLSFREPTAGEVFSEDMLDISGADEMIAEYMGNDRVHQIVSMHTAFSKVWLMNLKGAIKSVLSSSQFIWLRPADRGLWYALNQVGGSTAWIEGLAPWSQWKFEQLAEMPLDEPQTELMIDSCIQELRKTGFLKSA